ncbi:MAG: hypothetical protein IPL61_27725 [Myxococcales bacterium]|nr:hypothetical protein [Myxococcales bacterium]
MRLTPILSLFVLAAACGGDDGNNPSPTIIPGGGIHDPGIDGVVHVYVIDSATDAPIAGAGVRVGTLEGTTDATGLFTAKGDLTGPQMIVAKAAGYASGVWVGADGANVTANLDKTPTPTTPPPQAEISGTIVGWDAVPTPAADHLTAALVTYSQDRALGAADSDLPPPPSGGQVPSNVCVKSALASPPCAWRINARVGTVAVFAYMADIDTRGTPASDDDVFTITGFATAPNLTIVAGAAQANVSLTQLAAGSTTTASGSFGAPPAGLTASIGIVGVDIGDAGVMRMPPIAPSMTTTVVPSLSAIPGSTYEFIALAQEDVTDGTAAQSIVLRRGLTSASSLSAGDWLPPPSGLSSDRASASFAAVAGASAHVLEFDTNAGSGTGNRLMSLVVLDGSSTVTLPVDFAPLPSGGLAYKVSAFDAGADFDPRDFEINDLDTVLDRLSSETIKLN